MRILQLFWLTAGLIVLLFSSQTATYREFKYAPNRPDDFAAESDSSETTAPDPPRNVRCVASTYSVILYWDHPLSKDRTKVRGYSIEWGIGSPSYNSLVPDTETSYSINELKPNTTYTFGIFAFNDVGDSETAEITATTTPVENQENTVVLSAPVIQSIKVLSTTSVVVQWNDPNVYYKYDNENDLLKAKKLYYIKYGVDRTNIFNEIASKNTAAVLTHLKPGNTYTIMVRVSVDDEQSPWSSKKTVELPQKSIILGRNTMRIDCKFEKTDLCQFVTDRNSVFEWFRMAPKPIKKYPQHDGYYMLLKSLDVNMAGHSRLISNKFQVENCKQLCVSFRVYNKKTAKGKFGVKILDNDLVQDDFTSTVYLERLEKFDRNVWQHVFINANNQESKFKILFDVQKDIGKPLWLAIADISIQCGTCKQQNRKYSKYYNSLSG